MKCYIVTEGTFDSKLLTLVVAQYFNGRAPDVSVVTGAGKSAASALARSLLTRRGFPTLLFVDADAVDPEIVGDEKRAFEASLSQVAPPGLWGVVLAVPELEVCFFEAKDFLEQILGTTIATFDPELARFNPKGVLDRLLPKGGRDWLLGVLKTADLSPLFGTSAVRQVLEFVETATRATA